MSKILDCGHGLTATAGIGTGYGRTGGGRPICYSCADDEQRAELLAPSTAPFFAYISSDHKTVTTWTGGALGTVTSYHEGNKRWTNFGPVSRCYIRVTDVHGQTWHGSGPVENGDYVRLRKTTKQSA